MKNFVQVGETLTLTAPYARNAGEGALVGSLFGVAVDDVANAAEGEFAIVGVFDITRETGAGSGFSQGAKLYWDNTNKRVTKTATGNTLIGVAAKAAADGDATVRILLSGVVY